MRGYRLLLRLLPADFRAAYGAEMERMLEARLAAARGRLARARVRMRAVLDVLHVALAERLGPRRRVGAGSSGAVPAPSGRGRAARLLDELRFDARFALRTLCRWPAFTLGAVLTLAVGIGTATAFFAVVDGILLRPLPWPDADRLVSINSPYLTPGTRADWLASLPAAERAAAYTIGGGSARTPAGAVRVRMMPSGEGFLDLVGARPVVGRRFTAGDHAPGAAPVALVREDFWRRWWGDAAPVGATLEIDGRSHHVVGVLPSDFYFFLYRDVDVWTPLEPREVRSVSLVARLPDGVGPREVRPLLETFAERMATPELRARAAGLGRSPVSVHFLEDALLEDARSTLWIFMAAGVVVLLLAIANVAALWIGRALNRGEDLALRFALGAGRGRLVRQLTVEALLVALAGAALGLALALFAPAIVALAPGYIPRTGDVGIDARAAGFACLAAVVAALLFGVGPAIAAAARAGTRGTRRTATEGRRSSAAQGLLVMAEVAAALVLVVGAGLLARTYDTLRPAEPGFRVRDRVVASIALPGNRYGDPVAQRRFASELLGGVERVAGPGRAAIATDLPLSGLSAVLPVPAVDGLPADPDEPRRVHFRSVTPGYFELMEMPVLVGRSIAATDVESAPRVAVVNESAARRLWGEGAFPVGRELTVALGADTVALRVVGVVRDAWIIRGPEPRPEVYAAYAQVPLPRFYVVSASTPSSPVPPAAIRRAVSRVDPDVPVVEIESFESLVHGSVVLPRFQATVLAALTAVALFLAATGTFAVLSQMIGRRRRELGIRIALGARGVGIVALVLGRAGRIAAAGIALGTGIAWAGARVLEAHLYGVTPHDPATFIAAVGVLLITVLLASLRPALRAARVDPVHTLREE